MTEKPPPEGWSDKDAESGKTAMQRFQDLARGLLRVTPDQIKGEQARYEEENGGGKKRRTLRAS